MPSEPYNEMQNKLQDGLRILGEASEEDHDRLGRALIKLQGALEDCLRLELSQKAPHLQLEMEAAARTMLPYAQQYLGLSEGEARLISDAERQCQRVTRGSTYTQSRAELVKYAEFVQRWCTTRPRNRIQPEEAVTPASSGPAPGLSALHHKPETGRPWYTSNWLIVAYSAVFMVIFCILGFIPYSDTFMEAVRKTLQRLSLGSVPAETPLAVAPPTLAAANTGTACVIIWVEHPTDNLGRKSRATVYEDFVSDEVKAAGMTPREFYELVVEHNPVLITDEYEFKRGKTYSLPQCQ